MLSWASLDTGSPILRNSLAVLDPGSLAVLDPDLCLFRNFATLSLQQSNLYSYPFSCGTSVHYIPDSVKCKLCQVRIVSNRFGQVRILSSLILSSTLTLLSNKFCQLDYVKGQFCQVHTLSNKFCKIEFPVKSWWSVSIPLMSILGHPGSSAADHCCNSMDGHRNPYHGNLYSLEGLFINFNRIKVCIVYCLSNYSMFQHLLSILGNTGSVLFISWNELYLSLNSMAGHRNPYFINLYLMLSLFINFNCIRVRFNASFIFLNGWTAGHRNPFIAISLPSLDLHLWISCQSH